MQSHSTMPARFTFKDLTLRQVEEELVAAAIDHEHALIELYGARRLQAFRSEHAYELNQITNVLFAWHDRGLYNPARNRARLDKHFDPGFIDALWCPAGIVLPYVVALCAALVRSNELFDEAVSARIRWQDEDPIGPSVTITRRVTKPAVGFMGGIGL